MKFLIYVLLYFSGIKAQPLLPPELMLCPPITIDDLGNTTAFTTDGLIARALFFNVVNLEFNGDNVPTLILDYRVLCESAGMLRNTISSFSALVTYQCDANTFGCDRSNQTDQFQFSCQENDWAIFVGLDDRFVITFDQTATFSTEPNDRCSMCIDDRQDANSNEITHCLGNSM